MGTLDQCFYPRLFAHWKHNSPHLCTQIHMHSQNLQWTWHSQILSFWGWDRSVQLSEMWSHLNPSLQLLCLSEQWEIKGLRLHCLLENLHAVVQIPRSISQSAITAPLVFLQIYLSIILTITINPSSLLSLGCKQQNCSSQAAMWQPACAAGDICSEQQNLFQIGVESLAVRAVTKRP